MVRKFGVAAMVLTLSACATRSPPPPPPPPPPAPGEIIAPAQHGAKTEPRAVIGERCPPTAACAPKEKSPYRQYYDAHHRRYYYYDPMKRRYFWENGQPKT